MNKSSSYHNLPDGYEEEKPFRMSNPDDNSFPEIDERVDSLLAAPHDAKAIPFPRNHFFGGVCLALPLSALLWVLIIYVL